MSIRQIAFLDEPAYELENEHFRAIVLPTQGSNLISLFDKKKEVELLRTPGSKEEYESRKMLFGTPVLFPPNRIEDARFTFHGRTYELEMNRAKEDVHIHGFVHSKEWTAIEQNEETNTLVTRLSSVDHDDIMEQFPHEFIMEMSVQLTNDGVTQILKIKNNGDDMMPVGVGYHTTFNFPIESSKLFIEVEKRWELNGRHLPTGVLSDVQNKEEFNSGIILKGAALDDVYPMTSNRTAVMEHSAWNTRVTYTAGESFKHWVLFTADGNDDLLAIEPYSWVTNAPNLNMPEELTGLYGLKAGETKEYTTAITVTHI